MNIPSNVSWVIRKTQNQRDICKLKFTYGALRKSITLVYNYFIKIHIKEHSTAHLVLTSTLTHIDRNTPKFHMWPNIDIAKTIKILFGLA